MSCFASGNFDEGKGEGERLVEMVDTDDELDDIALERFLDPSKCS